MSDVLPIDRSEAGMRKTGTQSPTSIDSSCGSRNGRHPQRASAVAQPGAAIASSGTVWKEVEATQVGPPLHVLGAQVDPVKSQIDSRNYLQQHT
jgi:hypothetical protein